MKKIVLLIVLSLFISSCQMESSNNDSFSAKEIEKQNKIASITPYEPYGETIEYTLAKLTGLNNMPDGDTYEDNAITRFLKEKLNVQNIDVIEAQDSQYENSIDMFISSKKLPDVMIVQDYDDLKYLVDNDLIADLSDAYKNCTTDKIKEIYASYGDTILDNVTFDGKIMALPETNIINGPNLIWLRKDWMDKLSLDEPKSLKDVENIVEQFITKDPGGNGEGNTIGLMVINSLVNEAGYSAEYLLDVIFAYYDAYPKQWIEDENGQIVYGSTTQEAKKALEHIHELYKKGIIDKDFILRTTHNIVDEIVEGHCGSFFGPWWASNNPLVDAVKNDSSASWKCYLIPTEDDGSVSYFAQNPSSKYVVVRKEFEHPEIIFKMTSVQFDYLRFEDKTVEEINNYERNNVDQTARPLSINIDYADALMDSHDNIKDVINGDKDIEDIPILDASYAKACLDYLKKDDFLVEDWAAYSSRIEAPLLFDDKKLISHQSLFYGQTETMETHWWKLEELENNTYIEMIVGEKDVSYFDDFVKEWNEQGGSQITKEVRNTKND